MRSSFEGFIKVVYEYFLSGEIERRNVYIRHFFAVKWYFNLRPVLNSLIIIHKVQVVQR